MEAGLDLIAHGGSSAGKMRRFLPASVSQSVVWALQTAGGPGRVATGEPSPCYVRRQANGLSHRCRLCRSAASAPLPARRFPRVRRQRPRDAGLYTPWPRPPRGALAPPTGGSADSPGRLFLGITWASLYPAENSHRTPRAALGRSRLPRAGTEYPLSCATK